MASSVLKFQNPLPSDPVTQKVIRPELNMEKLANIWQPAKAMEKLNKIVIERPNGARIQVTANTEYGSPTTETQKVLYALYQISEEQGHPRRLFFSERKIAKVLKKQWGNSTKKIIDTGLYQLRFTAFVLSNAFFDATKNKNIKLIDTFTLLSALKIAREQADDHPTKEACYCEFNEYLYNNLVNGHVKPLLFETLLSLGGDGIAQIFYTHLDVILSSEERPLGVYRRRSAKLFEEFNLIGKEYQKLNFRKKTLERVKAKLDGKELSKGGRLRLTIEKTADNQDYNLVAQRDQPEATRVDQPRSQVGTQPDTRPAAPGVPTATPSTQAAGLVQYFHSRFFRLEEVEPQPRELKQAADLIQKHGFEVARFVVDYAFRQAQETRFKLALFGGILQYVGQARAHYQQAQAATESLEQKRERLIQTCPLGCRTQNGQVFWTKTDDQNGVISQMECLHDAARHRAEEHQHQIRIALTREALTSLM